MNGEDANKAPHVEEVHFKPLILADCKVPIGCPAGLDCPEDAFPNHHYFADATRDEDEEE